MSNHNYFRMFPEHLLAKQPEYFAIVDGKATAAQIRTTSPEVIRIAAEKAAARFSEQPHLRSFSLMPNDNIQWDERPEATRLDGPNLEHPWLYGWPLSDVAPRLITFLNSVAEAVTKGYPNRWFCTYVMYHRMQRPTPGMRVHPNAIIGLTLHDRNCVRPLADQSDQRNRYVLDTIKAWQALIPRGFVRTYFPPYRVSSVVFRRPRGHIADMQLLLAMERVLGCKNEYADDCATHLPGQWIRSRWLLHPEREADELLLDFYANFYGAARGPMMAYHELCEWALGQATVVVMPGTRGLARLRDVYPREVERRMDEYLDLASRAARRAGAIQRDRVRLVRYGHEYLRKALGASDALVAYRPEQALENVRSMRRIALEAWRFNRHAFQHNAQGKPFSPSLDWEERRLEKALSTESVGGAG